MVERMRRCGPSYTTSYVSYDHRWPEYLGTPNEAAYVSRGSDILSGHQRLVSEGHPFSRIGKTDEDIGGDFRTERIYLSREPDRQKWGYGSTYERTGSILPSHELAEKFLPNATMRWDVDSPAAPDDFLDERGATAISRTAPTNPVASAAVNIGELREKLPSLPGLAMLRNGINPKTIGGEHLNAEFALKPTIASLQDFIQAYDSSERILEQLERDSGRNVRRRYTFPDDVSESEEVRTGVFPWAPGTNVYHVAPGTLTITKNTRRKVWFKGAFTYYLPPRGTWRRKESEMNKLYGTRVTADTLYQLTPWSWAVDWGTNLGDVIKNLSLFTNDGLVLRYGYVMCHTTQWVRHTWEGDVGTYGSYSTRRERFYNGYTWETKQRRAANPFGFGITFDGLNARQLSIIAALGMTRGRGHTQ